MRPLEISGKRFGRLTAVSRQPNQGRRTIWLFRCDCGNEKELKLDSVTGGLVRSCGCLRADATRERSFKHGAKQTPEYRSWCHAKERCFNAANPKYPQYGGRGITMCDEWKNDFLAFLRNMGPRPSDKTSLDRIDVNKGYEPGNCRWANSSEQARTRTDNVLVRHEDRVMILKDFAKEIGVNYKTLHRRLRA